MGRVFYGVLVHLVISFYSRLYLEGCLYRKQCWKIHRADILFFSDRDNKDNIFFCLAVLLADPFVILESAKIDIP